VNHPLYIEVSSNPRETHPITVHDHKTAFSLRVEEAQTLLALLPKAIEEAKATRKAQAA